MHGVKRQQFDAEVRRRKLAKDVAKIKNYKEITEKFFTLRESKDYSSDTFKLTTSLLNLNPEFSTVWNYRREILLKSIIPKTQPDALEQLFDSELNFTMAQLKRVPKCYWVWNHRQWCFKTDSKANMMKELMIVNKLLDLDARNFHGWHYRRYVIGEIEKQSGKSQSLKELAYTTKLINKNFSNYSALHNRTKLIGKIFSEKEFLKVEDQEDEKILEIFKDKFTFITAEIKYFTNAIYTDPDDQSVWLYLNWLLTSEFFSKDIEKNKMIHLLISQINTIDELNDLEKEDNDGIDNKWCLKVKSSIEMVLYNKFDTKDFINYEGESLSIKEDISSSVEALKAADSFRLQRYNDIQKSLNI